MARRAFSRRSSTLPCTSRASEAAAGAPPGLCVAAAAAAAGGAAVAATALVGGAFWYFMPGSGSSTRGRSEEHTSELQSLRHLVCRLPLETKNQIAQVVV